MSEKKYRVFVKITDEDTGEVMVSNSSPFVDSGSIIAVASLAGRQFNHQLQEAANLIKEDE